MFINDVIRLGNVNKVIIGDLNINSVPNKFNQLREIVQKYVDVLVTTKTILDDTFLKSLFLVTGFSVPYRLDWNRNVFQMILKVYLLSWILVATYFSEHITRHLKVTHYSFNNLDKVLDVYSHYDKKLLVGNFNTEVSGNVLGTFLYQITLKILSKIKPVSKMQRLLAPLSFFFWLIIL